VIAVFHDLNLAAQYSDRLILLDNGRIVSNGLPDEVLTPENIKKTYNVNVIIKRHPITNTPYITPYYFPKHEEKSEDYSVHVICGGGSGSDMMRLLLNNGFKVTTGVLNVLDSDFETARNLKIPVIGEIPFSQITNDSHKANIELIREANIVIVTDFIVGPGNLKNIETAEMALDSKVPVVIICSTPISQRDFIQGNLEKYFNRLREKRAIFVENPNEALKTVLKELSL